MKNHQLQSWVPRAFAAFTLIQTAASASQLPVSAPRDAGVYHVATGTFSRPNQSMFGPDVIYRNDVGAPYFMPVQAPQITTDSGRIPGPTSEGNSTTYRVDGFTFGYCTDDPGGVQASVLFYESYAPCTRPLPWNLAKDLILPGLPGASSAGVAQCWQITIDLSGTTNEFIMDSDGGDAFFDGDPEHDSFGWSIQIGGAGGGNATGPMISGDPALAGFGDGTKAIWGFGPAPGTGLGQQDFLWTEIQGASSCTDLGGYPNARWAGLNMVTYGKKETVCLAMPDSTFEPNNSCVAPSFVSNGTYTGLFTSNTNEDWYAIQVDEFRSLRIRANFSHAFTNLDLDIYEGLGCSTFVGTVNGSSISVDEEFTEVFNTTAFSTFYVIRVYVNDSGGRVCNNYDLTLGCCEGTDIGNSFCTPTPNSTGFPAKMFVTGSVAVSDRKLCLQAEPVPANTIGVFHTGLTQASVPFGDGIRCVGWPLLRLGPLAAADGGSTIICHDDDIGGPGSQHISPGETWHFQAMFRDPMGGPAGFNTTDGVSVTFQ
ncbi:MAG: hypothetical protein ACI841_004003 [Planctomycetota bacterium]|jgi:hypothetical protein